LFRLICLYLIPLYKKVISCWSLVISNTLAICYVLLTTSASAQVVANFSASPTAGCATLIVNFTDLSTGSPTSWSWDFGNGAPISTSQFPSTFYTLPGVYTVILTASNGSSTDTETKTNYIVVYNKPVGGFTMSADTACAGQNVTFTDATVISPGGAPIGTWAWNFGDGNNTTVTVPTVTHAYTTPGTYPVSLIVTDTNGCSGSVIVQNIVVVTAPVLFFSAAPTFACTPILTVTFTNTSTTTGTTTYTWNFGDGATSTVSNTNPAVHTYTASGTFNVTLIVNQSGCVDSLVIPNYIIIQNIVASIAATPTVACTGQTITFNNTSVPVAVTANWNFGDATTSAAINPTHTYSIAGTFTVTLITSSANGCIDTTTVTVLIHQTPVASFIADTMVACNVPFTVTFTNTSTGGTNYLWNFGDGGTSTLQNPVYTYTASGTYNVTLTVTNAAGPCVTTIVMSNFIFISPPVASMIHFPDSGCVPLTVNFLSTSTSLVDPIATYSWSFGDGNSAVTAIPATSNTYTATGIYSVTLTITTANGCVDTVVCLNCIKVGIPPVANFGILQDTVCYGLPVNFSDSSTGNVTGWYWSFGDGGSSVLQNPIYVYGDTGTYQVYLIAYNNGCGDTSLLQNVVILPPKAIFTFTLSCTNYYTVQFTSTSDGADSLFWNFGDGSMDSSNIINPIHTYTATGPYTVSLTAYNYATGCSNTITATFTIAEPIASYSVAATTGCYPFSVILTSTSQDAFTYYWDLGDLSSIIDTSTADTAAYTYNNTGQYFVTLIITDVNGCKDTLIDTLGALGPYPYFYADTLTGCRPFLVTFIDTSVSDSTLTQWVWDFGDGSPIATTNNDSIIHIYTVPGIYSVTMTITDANGCVKTIIKTNYIQPTFPYPAFTIDTFACKFDVLTFTSTGTAVGPTYLWNFGDGNTSTLQSPTHAYANDSLYIVTLTVTDTNGCDSTITDTIRILKPTANFSWAVDTMYCGAVQIAFTDSSTGFVTSWNWDFGNGGTAIIQNPTAFYTTGGIYSVTLIVTNAGGCIDTLRLDSIIIVPLAVGTFTFTPTSGCNPLTVCFSASAQNTAGYIWNFGDGTVLNSTGADTCHIYTNPGTWTPQLELLYVLPGGDTCTEPAPNLSGAVTVTDVINDSILVNGIATSAITVPQDSIILVTDTFNGGTPPYTYSWSPGTGINCASCASVFIVGTGDTILYTFTIYDSLGCISISTIKVYSEPCFEEKLIPNIFSPNGDGVNDVFYIPGVCSYEKYSLRIYDRWGVHLFSTTLRNNGWDGRTSAGIEAKDGVYYFVVTITEQLDQNGLSIDDPPPYRGFVHLVR